MDTRMHQFLSATISPAYADEARRRIARKRAEKRAKPHRRQQLQVAVPHGRRPTAGS